MGKHVKQVTFCYFYKVVPYRFVSQPTARCSCSATTTAANLAVFKKLKEWLLVAFVAVV